MPTEVAVGRGVVHPVALGGELLVRRPCRCLTKRLMVFDHFGAASRVLVPMLLLGRRARALSRASQDRIASTSAGPARRRTPSAAAQALTSAAPCSSVVATTPRSKNSFHRHRPVPPARAWMYRRGGGLWLSVVTMVLWLGARLGVAL